MHQMEQKLKSYLILMTVYIGIPLNLLEKNCGYFREEIPCEILGVYTLVRVNQNFSDEG